MNPLLYFFISLAVIAVLATCQSIRQRREVAVNDASPVHSMLVEKAKCETPRSDRRSCQREERTENAGGEIYLVQSSSAGINRDVELRKIQDF